MGRRLEPDDHRLRDFLTRAAQPHEFHEAGTPQADAVLALAGARGAALPVVIDGDTVHAHATVESLADAWTSTRGREVALRPDDRRRRPRRARGRGVRRLRRPSTAVAEEDVPGGQASHTSLIENFFGFVEGIGGAELARLAGRQAERFGAELLILNGMVGSHFAPGEPARGRLSSGDQVTADIVLVACGMEWRRLELDGVDELLGHGVYYGAGRSEASQCAGEDVMVVGAGNSAGQAVMNLASAGARVRMVVRGDSLSKSMSAYLVERVEEHPNIDVRLRTRVAELHAGGRRLRDVTIESADGEPETIAVSSLFLCIGGVPRTEWAEGRHVRTDKSGFILTGPDLLEAGRRPEGWPLDRDPLALETSVPGLFAAGDVRHGSTKRVAGAVGEGAMAVTLAYRRLEELRREA